ncbi:hypothetical protein [Rhodococcus sp. 1168]|uniref:phage scaffolding protein n=1 Tax=Rhodococcus sp. 1168 TaxID=2018041 RepID=UPI000F73E7AC|nr:hypothetical protein [Rhodococcus sp. 1168]
MSEQETETAEMQELRQKLKAANDEAAGYRIKNKELTEQFEAQQQGSSALKQSLVQTQISNQLAAQGITNSKYAKMISSEDIEFDDQGNAVGLAERIDQLKRDYPESADAKRRAPKVDASDKQPSAKPLSSAQKLLQQTN